MKLGFNGVISYLNGSGGVLTGTRASWGGNLANGLYVSAAPAGLIVVGHVQDCSINAEKNAADASSRDSIFELQSTSLIKAPIDFKVIWDPSDPGQIAILASFMSTTPSTVPMAVLDGAAATSGSTGWWADWTILKMNEGQPLKEGQICDISIFPGPSAVPPQRVKVA